MLTVDQFTALAVAKAVLAREVINAASTTYRDLVADAEATIAKMIEDDTAAATLTALVAQ